jgi:uncharacterized membrane protein
MSRVNAELTRPLQGAPVRQPPFTTNSTDGSATEASMTNPTHTPTTTAGSLAPNVAGALAYVLGIITGVIFLVIEKENRFVRFHAAQSIAVTIVLIVVSVGLSVLSTVLAFVPILGWIVALLLSVVLFFATFVLWVLLMWRAYQGREWDVPIAGGLARKIMG